MMQKYDESTRRNIGFDQLVKLLPDSSIATLQSGALMVTCKTILLNDDLCFSVVSRSEIAAVISEKYFMVAMCIRNEYSHNRCIIPVAFKDGSEFLKIVGDMDSAVLQELYK
jgi:hypothetical protein